MLVTVEELELAIRNNLQERQDYLDKANACAGAVKLLQGLLAEAQKDIKEGVIDATPVPARKRK